MVLKPRLEPWTRVSDAEHLGINHFLLVRRSEREGGLTIEKFLNTNVRTIYGN